MDNIKIDDNYISLLINIEGLPKEVEIKGSNLIKKTSFHVSLICIKNIIKNYGQNVADKVKKLFEEFNLKTPIKSVSFRKEFRFAVDKSRNRKTLVIMVDIKSLQYFFDQIRYKFNLRIDNQPTHVTLYTLKMNEGIGINNTSDLNNLTKIVNEYVPQEIKEVFNF